MTRMGGGRFFIFFFLLFLFILGKRVKKILKNQKECSVRLRFLHKFSKAVNGFFSGAGSSSVELFFRKKEVTFLIHTITRGGRRVRDRMGIYLTNSSQGIGLILLPSSNF